MDTLGVRFVVWVGCQVEESHEILLSVGSTRQNGFKASIPSTRPDPTAAS